MLVDTAESGMKRLVNVGFNSAGLDILGRSYIEATNAGSGSDRYPKTGIRVYIHWKRAKKMDRRDS